MALDIPSGLTGEIRKMAEQYNMKYYGVEDATPDPPGDQNQPDTTDTSTTGLTTTTDGGNDSPTYKGHPRSWWTYTGSDRSAYSLWVDGTISTSLFQGSTPPGEGTAALERPAEGSTDSSTDTTTDGTPSVDSAAEARERYGPGADQASTGGLVDTSGGSSGDPTETTSPSGSGSMAGLSDTAMLAGLAALGIAAIAYRRGS